MSKTLNSLLAAHLRGDVTSLCLCWKIVKKNGDAIFGTDHDLDVVIATGALAGTYEAGANITGADVASSDDMSVDNTEVTGAFPDNLVVQDLTVDDIRAGLLNNAPITLFFTSWLDTSMGQCYVRNGFLGELTWDTNSTYKTEIRGLTQLLTQNVVQTYSVPCNVVKFGDARCKVDVDALTIVATVTSVVSRREFTVSGMTTQPAGFFETGAMLGLTGANAGYTKQVRLDDTDATAGKLTMFEAYPEDVHIGDTFSLPPGCDRTMTSCVTFPDSDDPTRGNAFNYRGYGYLIPGVDAIMRGAVGVAVPVSDPSGGSGGGFSASPGV